MVEVLGEEDLEERGRWREMAMDLAEVLWVLD